MSINDSLRIGSSALFAHQQALQVIAHNLANVNTDAYHRQNAKLAPTPPLYTGSNLVFGTGVTVTDIVRTYNQMAETLLLEQKSNYAYHSTKANALLELQDLVSGTDDTSLSVRFQQFWDAWQDIASDPSSISARNVLLERAAALTYQIGTLSERLTDFRNEIASGAAAPFSGSLAREVETVNSLATEIAALNSQITTLEAAYNCNDLKDERDALIRKLSEKANITVASDFAISIDAQVLVSADGATCNALTQTGSDPIAFTINGTVVNISSGSIGAWIDAASDTDSLLEKLNTLAGQLITEVNLKHTNGYDLNGTLGIAFFSGSDASDIAVNITDPRLVAAAATRYAVGQPNTGDGANALEIAQLAYATPAGLDEATFQDYFNNALVSLGATASAAQAAEKDSKLVVTMLLNAIQAESGVSEDEEMVNMISFQRAYQAAAKIITAINEMMDTLIKM